MGIERSTLCIKPEGKPTATTVPFLLVKSTAVLNALGDVAKQATACDPPLVYFVTYEKNKSRKELETGRDKRKIRKRIAGLSRLWHDEARLQLD